jgi:hypothetical protein
MTKNVFAGVGISKNDDPFIAGKEAVEKAINEMKKRGGKKPTFGLVFCSGGKYGKDDKTIQKLVDGAHSVFGDIPWVGCTTCGEISNYGLTTDSCLVSVISSEYLHVGIGIGGNVYKNAVKAGNTAAKQAVTTLQREKIITPYIKYLAEKRKTSVELMKTYSYFVLLLSPGLTLEENGMEDDVIAGVSEVVGKQIPIIGGTAGDNLRMLGSYQFANGKVYKDAAIATAISSELKIGFAFGHGYVPTDETCVVTKSDGYTVYELDKKPAGEVYAKMLGIKMNELWDTKSKIMVKMTPMAKFMSKYLSMAMDPRSIPFWSFSTTNPFGIVDIYGNIAIRAAREMKGNILEFQQKIPKNMALTKLKVDPKKVLGAEIDAIEDAEEDANAPPEVLFIFDCIIRKVYLGPEKMKRFLKFLRAKYPETKIIGFYAMGEFTFNRNLGSVSNGITVSVGNITDKLITE